MHLSTIVAASLAFAAGSVSAAKAVPPSSIRSFNPNAPAGLTTNYQPLLKVTMGCVPFPAVDVIEGGRFRYVEFHWMWYLDRQLRHNAVKDSN